MVEVKGLSIVFVLYRLNLTGNFNKVNRFNACFLSIMVLLLLAGCSSTENNDKADVYILKSPNLIVSISQFTEELELKKAGYNYNIKENPSKYNNIVIAVVKDLTEEMVLLEVAREKGIVVNEEDFKKAEADFLKDYPGSSFEDMLLENAIDYSFWKDRFIKRLTINRLIQQELREKVVINTEDVVEFYKKYKKEDRKSLSEDALIAQLREQKTEEKYFNWIDRAMVKYPVDVNKQELKKFLIGLHKVKF